VLQQCTDTGNNNRRFNCRQELKITFVSAENPGIFPCWRAAPFLLDSGPDASSMTMSGFGPDNIQSINSAMPRGVLAILAMLFPVAVKDIEVQLAIINTNCNSRVEAHI